MYALDLDFKFWIREDVSDYNKNVQLDEIMKKLFYIPNKSLIIDLLNSLYGDNLGYDADITYLNKEAIIESLQEKVLLISRECDMFIRANYQGKKYEYLLEFQTRNDKSIGIRLFRYSFELMVQNIKALDNPVIIEFPDPYIIVLEENSKVPGSYDLIIKVPSGESMRYSAKVLKYWEYNLDNLYKNNMHLLFPLKVFEVRKKITRLKNMNENAPIYPLLLKEVRDDILRVTKEILEHIDTIYYEKRIDDSEYEEFGLVLINLTMYLSQEIDKLSEVKVEVEKMVKTLYDPKVEERGIKIGEQNGDKRATLRTKREDILELLEDIGNISDEVKALIEKEEDFDILKRWLKLAARVGSIDEFMDKVRLH